MIETNYKPEVALRATSGLWREITMRARAHRNLSPGDLRRLTCAGMGASRDDLKGAEERMGEGVT